MYVRGGITLVLFLFLHEWMLKIVVKFKNLVQNTHEIFDLTPHVKEGFGMIFYCPVHSSWTVSLHTVFFKLFYLCKAIRNHILKIKDWK